MNNYDIIIDDGNILLKEYTVTKAISLTDFAKQLVQAEKEIETPILPSNCVKFKSDGKSNEYFILIPMGSYKVFYKHKTWVVTFPHQVMYFKFKSTDLNNVDTHSIKLFWNFSKDFSFDKKEFQKPAMHNIHSDNHFCMGSVKPANTQSEIINNWVAAYFENEFNDDINRGKRLLSSVSISQQRKYDITDENIDLTLIKEWLVDVDIKFKEKFYIKDLIGN